jgi:UDP-N-acetylmuramate--alanine ligase
MSTDPGRSEKNVCVVEADEYDRSFLKLSPDIAVISAMDPDHLDIYGTAEAMEQAFIDFSRKLKPGGLLVSKFGLKRGGALVGNRQLTYSLQNESADAYAENITIKNGSYQFHVNVQDNQVANLVLHMGGMHNVENAVAAITVASSLNIDNDRIRHAIETFKGVKRRFEYILKNDRIVFIDDYAHHPEELRALINGAQSLFRQKRCTIIFQPHLYSRTKDLAIEFAEVLDVADQVILLPIYPARELPIEGVSSELILKKMKNENKKIVAKEDLLAWVQRNYLKNINKEFGEVLITAGAGDIDTLVEPIKEILENI